MNNMSNILITGYPRTGKTTLIKKFLEQTTLNCIGFLTEEIRNDQNIRVGFKVVEISTNQTGILAPAFLSIFYRQLCIKRTKFSSRYWKYKYDRKITLF